jgi:hypothetical protein
MTCLNPECQANVAATDRFCPRCGTPRGPNVTNQGVSTGGGDISGTLYQAGRDVVVNPSASTPETASYEAVPRWRSPFTQGVLSWAGVIVGLIGLVPLSQLLNPLFKLLSSGQSDAPSGFTQLVWILLFLLAALVFGLVLGLRGIAKLQLRKPLIFGWAVSGAGRRITLEQIRAGRCPKCGGKMKYYNKPVETSTTHYSDGKKKTEVTQRVPALECRRNTKHWFQVDPAENEES